MASVGSLIGQQSKIDNDSGSSDCLSSDSSGCNAKAPNTFMVSSNEDDDNNSEMTNSSSNTKNSGLLKCPLCAIPRKKFYCQFCIKITERLLEKQQRYIQLQASLNELNEIYEKSILSWRTMEDVQFRIKQKKEKIALLRLLNENKKKLVTERTKYRDKLRIDNYKKQNQTLPMYESNVKNLEYRVDDKQAYNNRSRVNQQNLLKKLKETACNDIKKLIDYIFPICEVVLKPEYCHETLTNTPPKITAAAVEGQNIAAALAEAKNTSYIGGKWILRESGISEMQYQIVAPSLPANGDYAAYINWLVETKDDVPKSSPNEIFPSRVAAFRIVGALTYTTQLINLLSFYLNVQLPYRIAYGDFCKKLSEENFERKVYRLNSNIFHLAYSQGVNLSKIKEKNTLENLLVVLNCDLGHFGPNEVNNAPLVQSMESILIGMETATESESEDENSFRLDWEAVSNATAQDIEPMAPSSPTIQSTTNIASSFVNTAASLFRVSFLRNLK